MANVATYVIMPALWRPSVAPSLARLSRRVRYWRDAVYLGIGYLSLTWPVAAFLRNL